MAARQRADRGRHGRAGDLLALGIEDRRRLVRLEGAEGSDARQQQALPAACREQRLGQPLSGALGWHVDGGVGEGQRAARAGEPLDKHAVQKRAAQCRQKRRPRGNREDSRRAMGHARLLCGARGKASRPARGAIRLTLAGPRRAVPMHSRRPESRSAAGPGRPRKGAREFLRRAAAQKRGARRYAPPVERGVCRR